jgi:hypothetical protein
LCGKIESKFLAWVQSPGTNALLNNTEWPRLETYVKDVVGTFANDARVLGWDLWNEPYSGNDLNLTAAVEQLLPQVFQWARSVNPTQPLTSGPFGGDYLNGIGITTTQIQMNNSDVISFHK